MTRRALPAILVLLALVAACGGSDSDDPDGAAKSSGRLLSKTCQTPVDFETPDGWEVAAQDPKDPDNAPTGSFQNVCAAGAGRAGHLGALTVYVSATSTGSPQEILAAYLEADDEKEFYTERVKTEPVTTRSGSPDVARTSWSRSLNDDEDGDEPQPFAAFAVATEDGGVVVEAAALDDEEFEGVRPGLELALKTLSLR